MILSPGDGPEGLRQTAFPHPDSERSSLAPPPHYAEHTTTVLRDHLGLSPHRIDALMKENVLAR
jgi:hypothetical protein